jgi:hypothetical protein
VSNRPFWVCVLCVVFAACEGCAVRFERRVLNAPIPAAEVGFIVSGRTSMRDVVERLGAPQQIVGGDDRTIFLYRFLDAKQAYIDVGQIIGLATGVVFMPSLSARNAQSGSDVFQISFDERWIAQESAFKRGARQAHYSLWPF